MAEKKKGGGSKLSRSEVISVRLDPRLRWGAELAARKQRRTLSSFIEWAVEESLARNEIGFGLNGLEAMGRTWDVDDADRFAKTAMLFPELLTHEEQKLWKVIQETEYLWPWNRAPSYEFDGPGHDSRGPTYIGGGDSGPTLDYARVREHWDILQKVAKGEESSDALPKPLPEEPHNNFYEEK